MSMFKKGTKAYSIFSFKCPQCHEGDLFPTTTFSFKKSFDMHQRCPKCHLDYWPEPGFYYGAMFISYIFTGWFCLGFTAIVHWVLGWSLMLSFAVMIAILAVLFVLFFRLARAIWINIVVKFKSKIADSVAQK